MHAQQVVLGGDGRRAFAVELARDRPVLDVDGLGAVADDGGNGLGEVCFGGADRRVDGWGEERWGGDPAAVVRVADGRGAARAYGWGGGHVAGEFHEAVDAPAEEAEGEDRGEGEDVDFIGDAVVIGCGGLSSRDGSFVC